MKACSSREIMSSPKLRLMRWLGSRPRLPALFVLDRDATVRATAGDCGTEAVASLRAAIDHALGR